MNNWHDYYDKYLDRYRPVNSRCTINFDPSLLNLDQPKNENKGDIVMNGTKINWIVRNVETTGYSNVYRSGLPEIRMDLVGNIETINKDCTMKSIASHVHNLLNGNFTGFGIKKVHFNPPVTVVLWEDGTKTIVRAQEGDDFDPEKGLAMAISKKALGNKGNFNEVFKKWCELYYEKNSERAIEQSFIDEALEYLRKKYDTGLLMRRADV